MSSFDSLLSQFKRKHSAPNNSNLANDQRKKRCQLTGTTSNGTEDDADLNKTLTITSSQPASPPPIGPVSNIYLLCPANVTTGGPEACHQLCQMINRVVLDDEQDAYDEEKKVGGTAYVMYVELDEKNQQPLLVPTKHPKTPGIYEKYEPVVAKSTTAFDARDLIVFPEIWTEHLFSFAPKAQKSIWWLSVDNNKGQYFASLSSAARGGKSNNNIRHFYQSEYARNYLVRNGISEKCQALTKLFEYIPNERFVLSPGIISFVNHAKYDVDARDLDVVYNPVKGKHFTDEIIEQAKVMKSGIRFSAISGEHGKRLTPDEVTVMLLRAKIYIDFGPHPGMDRLPREAALAGCIVITNAQGAAGYDADVPIPSTYKFCEFDVYKITACLKESIQEYKARREDFNEYRKWIEKQRSGMEVCVKELVAKLRNGS
mmetsp:Transcript_7882/g.11636  ORF Transcript_7882/g.11636 Transcript_7882/m.11636 type:complete len:429 (-) Transcript_7882:82-1368(-)|eukprot:CAMPEP_0196818668 /NCGR_PEP_ID=MMETSP1362-20130617/66836_1 /TAXON_ID=163516 /ORGANISM="Leptocylindrus danicus, Strain CCMP1856" /LENGTH=428 /DNA_ID=CAMNT_0042196861 /DNA_START=81 /DNA_END=1370 /DNA_ORIENTATION=+